MATRLASSGVFQVLQQFLTSRIYRSTGSVIEIPTITIPNLMQSDRHIVELGNWAVLVIALLVVALWL